MPFIEGRYKKMYIHYKGLCKRHSSYSVLHHSFYSLNETFLIPQASAVHAAVCLTSEPLMHTDAVHQLLEPSQGVSSSLHSVQWLFEKNLLLVIQIKTKLQQIPSLLPRLCLFSSSERTL